MTPDLMEEGALRVETYTRQRAETGTASGDRAAGGPGPVPAGRRRRLPR